MRLAVPLLFLCFSTMPSRMPSVAKVPVKSLGSTGPGKWNATEKGPGGHSEQVCMWNVRMPRVTTTSPVVVVPLMVTWPSHSTSQLNSPEQHTSESVSSSQQRSTKVNGSHSRQSHRYSFLPLPWSDTHRPNSIALSPIRSLGFVISDAG